MTQILGWTPIPGNSNGGHRLFRRDVTSVTAAVCWVKIDVTLLRFMPVSCTATTNATSHSMKQQWRSILQHTERQYTFTIRSSTSYSRINQEGQLSQADRASAFVVVLAKFFSCILVTMQNLVVVSYTKCAREDVRIFWVRWEAWLIWPITCHSSTCVIVPNFIAQWKEECLQGCKEHGKIRVGCSGIKLCQGCKWKCW